MKCYGHMWQIFTIKKNTQPWLYILVAFLKT